MGSSTAREVYLNVIFDKPNPAIVVDKASHGDDFIERVDKSNHHLVTRDGFLIPPQTPNMPVTFRICVTSISLFFNAIIACSDP